MDSSSVCGWLSATAIKRTLVVVEPQMLSFKFIIFFSDSILFSAIFSIVTTISCLLCLWRTGTEIKLQRIRDGLERSSLWMAITTRLKMIRLDGIRLGLSFYSGSEGFGGIYFNWLLRFISILIIKRDKNEIKRGPRIKVIIIILNGQRKEGWGSVPTGNDS